MKSKFALVITLCLLLITSGCANVFRKGSGSLPAAELEDQPNVFPGTPVPPKNTGAGGMTAAQKQQHNNTVKAEYDAKFYALSNQPGSQAIANLDVIEAKLIAGTSRTDPIRVDMAKKRKVMLTLVGALNAANGLAASKLPQPNPAFIPPQPSETPFSYTGMTGGKPAYIIQRTGKRVRGGLTGANFRMITTKKLQAAAKQWIKYTGGVPNLVSSIGSKTELFIVRGGSAQLGIRDMNNDVIVARVTPDVSGAAIEYDNVLIHYPAGPLYARGKNFHFEMSADANGFQIFICSLPIGVDFLTLCEEGGMPSLIGSGRMRVNNAYVDNPHNGTDRWYTYADGKDSLNAMVTLTVIDNRSSPPREWKIALIQKKDPGENTWHWAIASEKPINQQLFKPATTPTTVKAQP